MSLSSAQTVSIQDLSHGHKLAVSFRLLLGLYAVIPICLLLQLLDINVWEGFLRQYLPSNPEHLALYKILFGAPHIVASTIIMTSNEEYLKLYKKKIILMTAALAAFFGIGSLFIPSVGFYLVLVCWTVYHVFKQQHGVARGICHLPDWAFYLLLWLSVTAGILVYIGIFAKDSLDDQQTEWLRHAAAGLCVGLALSTVLCQRYVTTSFGKWFLWANTLLVLSSFYLYVQQYYFLAILVPRLVHDATAYVFYVTHDYNKHYPQPQNFIYRYAARCNMHVFLVLPLISIVLAFVLRNYGDAAVNLITHYIFNVELHRSIAVGLLTYLAYMHYYTEAFTWKQGSPYRRFIAFTK
ncbi:hypothetical protein [Methylobacter sp. YRD-M1]|uniref:hypothetical protein n=1 Tax=Methylobacter sp. YRD-M1 TaxID=2911520 RepID=UPI00227B13D8|nr:hypothetical protein [Methylobacter sp. YRD-M1]WAK00705.1 hypothetical protein LZ558_12700 [Methylobacter sp. YRD-M1]